MLGPQRSPACSGLPRSELLLEQRKHHQACIAELTTLRAERGHHQPVAAAPPGSFLPLESHAALVVVLPRFAWPLQQRHLLVHHSGGACAEQSVYICCCADATLLCHIPSRLLSRFSRLNTILFCSKGKSLTERPVACVCVRQHLKGLAVALEGVSCR